MSDIRTSVIMLAYGTEIYLDEAVTAALTTTDEQVELILVDNGSPAAATLSEHPRLRIERQAHNLGFAGGCDRGGDLARGDTLVFLNSDAIVEPGAIARLAAAANEPGIGLASGDVRLAAAPDTMNTAGNPVHFLGVVWAGSYGEPATAHSERVTVASASGAFMAVTREKWDALGGFDASYFAYHEDTELSLRCWQRGWPVVFVPGAVVRHHYEFSRNPLKQYLLERNRWMTVLTVYPRAVLIRVLPALLLFEFVVLAAALVQGWSAAKVRSWGWLIRNRRQLAHRRAVVQAQSSISAASFAGLLVARIEPAMIERPPGSAVLNAVLAGYWRLARVGWPKSRLSAS